MYAAWYASVRPLPTCLPTRAAHVASAVLMQVQSFLLESFADGTEGLMLKRLDVGASYQPSKRTESWIKIKR